MTMATKGVLGIETYKSSHIFCAIVHNSFYRTIDQQK